MSQTQPLTSHISELIHRFIISAVAFGIALVFFFAFKPQPFRVQNGLMLFHFHAFLLPIYIDSFTVYYPYPSLFHSFSSILFTDMREHILPPGMRLINVGSFDTFLSAIYVAVPMAAVVSMPVWVYEMWAFVSPALKPREKKVVSYITIPASLLFLLGVVFAYELFLPILFHILYLFTVGFGVQPTISVKAFVSIVLAYMLAIGLCFETPIVMAAFTYVGLVRPKEWLRAWRYAMLVCFFIALLISPGATGGIMEVLIALMLFGLYLVGAVASGVIYRRSNLGAG